MRKKETTKEGEKIMAYKELFFQILYNAIKNILLLHNNDITV